MKIVALTALAVTLAGTSTALAAEGKTAKEEAIQVQLKRFYHADGFIKSIGHVARRTIYSPNLTIRTKWKKTLRRLILVRNDAKLRLKELRTPPRPPHYSQWMCIHGFEGAWNDPGAPYYGGLQMDLAFQRAYGPELLRMKGTADNWTPLEQMWVAERAWRERGFWPWPNTARSCGLL